MEAPLREAMIDQQDQATARRPCEPHHAPVAPLPEKQRDAIGRRIIEAVSSALLEIPSADISMSAAAKRAGVGRQTLYRRFSSKEQLLHAVYEERTETNIRKMIMAVPRNQNPVELIVGTMLASLEITERDAVLMNMIMATSSSEAGEFLLGRDSFNYRLCERLWCPILEHLRDRGMLRHPDQIEEYLQQIRVAYYVLLIRRDIPREQRGRHVQNFFLPILLSDAVSE